MRLTGELITYDGRPALRFERRLSSSVERVWRAATVPEELARWFLSAIPWTPREGETFEVFGQLGTVTKVEEQQLIAWEWGGGQLFRIELQPDGDGCLLVFTHVLDDRNAGAQQAAGWEGYLDRLAALVAGGFLPDEEAHADLWGRQEAYAERFGLDPEPGRRALAGHQPE